MDLTGIISITGKPGLYLVVAQGKNNIIVESLTDKKRIPAYSTDRISALDDISIYTYEKDVPLKEIYQQILEKENGAETLSHQEDLAKLQQYLLSILPDYDQERVYGSDIRKLFQWFNLLHRAGRLALAIPEESTEDKKSKPKAEKTSKKESVKSAVKKPKAATAEKKVKSKTSTEKK